MTWKDGCADEAAVGCELVAVLLLEDSAEMRRVRRDTWPERPGARRDAADAAAAAAEAAAAAASTAAAAGADVPPSEQQPGKGKGSSGSPPLMKQLLEQPARLLDWRDKLRLLQQERRQQRVAQVQAGWAQQTKQPRRQQQGQQQAEQLPEQRQQRQQQDSTAAAHCVKPASCTAAGPICLNAVAAAVLPQPAAC